MMQFSLRLSVVCFGLFLLHLENGIAKSAELPSQGATAILEGFCIDCHSSGDHEGDFDLESILAAPMADHLADWEAVVRKLQARQMPPADATQLSKDEHESLFGELVTKLNAIAESQPTPGRVETLRRLNRTEYQNAIRDLLALEIDATKLLPADESSHGFDNITVGELSPLLLNRYISAAQKISRLAVGSPGPPAGDTFRPPADRTQEDHVSGLPLGTRGGLLIPYTFPRDGEYEFQIHLTRDRNEQVEGLRGTHQLEILFDRQQKATFEVKPPKRSKKP